MWLVGLCGALCGARPSITRRGQLADALTGFLDDDGEDLSATAAIS